MKGVYSFELMRSDNSLIGLGDLEDFLQMKQAFHGDENYENLARHDEMLVFYYDLYREIFHDHAFYQNILLVIWIENETDSKLDH